MTDTQAVVKLLRDAFSISAARVGLSLFTPAGIAALGSAGVEQQAAFGLAATFNNWFLVVGPAVLLSGFFKSAEAARRGQSTDRDLLQSVLSLCAIVAAVSLLVALGLSVAMRWIYPNETGRLASHAFLIQSLSNVFYFYLAGIMLFLEGLGRSRVVVAIILGSLAMNVAINQIFVLKAPTSADPSLLASWSLLVSRAVSGIAVLLYLSRFVLPLRPREVVLAGNRATINSLLRIGTANGAGKAAEAAAFAGLGGLAASLGAEAMTSYAIFYGFASIVYMYMIGLTNATIRSLAPKAADSRPHFDLLRAWLLLFAGVIALMIVLGISYPQGIWRWFSPSGPVSLMLEQTTLPAIAAALSFTAVFLVSQMCRAVGLHHSTSACMLFTYPLLMVSMAWFFTQVRSYGLAGLVWSFIGANAISLALLLMLYWRQWAASRRLLQGRHNDLRS
jgi:Na+-driven multidrug efflux pump